VITY